MKQSGFVIAFVALMLSACGNKTEQEPAAVTAPLSSAGQDAPVAVEQPASPAMAGKAPEKEEPVPAVKPAAPAMMEKPLKEKVPEKAASVFAAAKPAAPVKTEQPSQAKAPEKTGLVSAAPKPAALEKGDAPSKVVDEAKGGVLGREEGLALAGKSGCLACHKIEAKLVGPAWRDVSKRYKGDPGAKAALIAKVKAGGKGNWTDVTGGIAMPPNSPRVSDENIEKLVTFVLSQ